MSFLGMALAATVKFGLLSGAAFIPNEEVIYYRESVHFEPLYVNMYAEGKKNIEIFGDAMQITAFGGIDNYFTVTDWNSFNPFSISWYCGAKASLGDVEIGYARECHHPTTTYVIDHMQSAAILSSNSTEGVSHDFYVKFTIGCK